MKLFNKLMEGGGTTYSGPSVITPGKENITIPKDTIIKDELTILGDSDLISDNIRKDVDIFGIIGNMSEGISGLDTGTISASNVSSLTIPHNLGASPKIFILFPIDTSTTFSRTTIFYFNVNGYAYLNAINNYGFYTSISSFVTNFTSSSDFTSHVTYDSSQVKIISDSTYPFVGEYRWMMIR